MTSPSSVSGMIGKTSSRGLNQDSEVFLRNIESYPVGKVENVLMTDERVKKMRFRSYKSFDRTCLGLEQIKKTLRYNFYRMQPIISENLKKTEYLQLEPHRLGENKSLGDYKSLKQYIREKRKKDQEDSIKRRI